MAPGSRPKPARPEPHEGFIAVGYIRGPHGLDGELKIDSLSDNPERFTPGAAFRAGEVTVTIRAIRPHRGALLIRFHGIDRREQADVLRGLLLEIPEAEIGRLGADEYYRFQLIGLEVRDTQGSTLGRLDEVLDTGGNDVYVVSDGESELLVPAVGDVVQTVDVTKGFMVIDPPPGLERRPLKKA